MEKQEVKSILDRLFDLSVIAKEKGHTLSYSLFNRSNAIGVIYFEGEATEEKQPLLNTTRLVDFDGKVQIESDIKLIESHLNS